MGVRSGAFERITDTAGTEHWVPIDGGPNRPRRGSLFWRGVVVLALAGALLRGVVSVLPVTQSSSSEPLSSYTVRTLSPSTTATTIPPTTKASGPAAVACQALGFR